MVKDRQYKIDAVYKMGCGQLWASPSSAAAKCVWTLL